MASNRGYAASPPCQSNGALGVTDSSVSTHCPSLAWWNLPSTFTLAAALLCTAGDTALGQLQPPHPHKPCRHFPDPPWQGSKGHLRRNGGISSLHCAALIMERFWSSVQRAQNNVLWEAQPCLAQILSQLKWLKATSEPLHTTRRAPASPPEYTMPCCSGPV